MSKAIILQHRNAARSKVVPAAADPRQFLLFDGAPYVFDGNCVVAHSDGGENGQGTWWLETVMPPYIWVFIGPAFKLKRFWRVGLNWASRTIGVFTSVFDTLKPLNEAESNCSQHGHRWGPAQGDSSDSAPYVWQWCLGCSAERVWFYETGDLLMWPEDDNEIVARTEGGLSTLHGPIVGGTSCNQ